MIEKARDLHDLATELAGAAAACSQEEAFARLEGLEEIKAACAAAQARETAQIDQLRLDDEVARGVPERRRGRGLSSEIGLARKASPTRGAQYLGFARALVHEMPHTRAALETGVLTEWRATILVRETAYLTRETRTEIDRLVCADPTSLVGVSDKQLEATVKKRAYELDPEAVVGRIGKAQKDRRVSVRPAPDVMAKLSALLPLAQGISVYAALKTYADSVVGGDDRTRSQIMADTLVERVTGQSKAAAVPIAVNVVMSERTLLGDSNEAAEVEGYGPVPAHVARRLITDGFAADSEVATSIRRLYMRPTDGSLVSMDAKSRCFPKALAHFIKMRDRICRVDYCGAAIEEIDHALPHRLGGATDAENGNGLCRAHNHAKEADGWTFTVHQSDGGHVIDIVTPFGRGHASTAATAVGFRFVHDSLVDARLRAALNAA
ncbi:DUF222 domain-containing protein [Gordonia sp. ABSL11-1]|uniref:HNH endonuclease signature motif containing protein n=1 Tax=Gordonia sp. ABSL11-1 TaxID=3053924 RepID=UPI00257237FA|nr:HNH endonuclease signature motif containing protein [Gordonia sp. ABSL11-1]MDL9945941.1 DUF222 domain-containing protein [Gordonia sp. ABSL11-1]